ncbi:MAG: hypothetical protein KFF50_15990 [Desulfatitalea sp.]|nr:hypothetical protein [Desulfatitalea sp.]
MSSRHQQSLPVIEPTEGGITVKVGSNPHPMEEKHYIEWIEITDGDTVCKQYLKPGQSPEAIFKSASSGVTAREYCNVHGVWKS